MKRPFLYALGAATIAAFSAMTVPAVKAQLAQSSYGLTQANMDNQQETMLQQLAEVLNMTPQNLKNELNSGKTLGQILQQQNISQQEFKNRVMADVNSDLSERVQEGKITQQQADQYRQQFQQMLDNHLNEILNQQHPLQQQQPPQQQQQPS